MPSIDSEIRDMQIEWAREIMPDGLDPVERLMFAFGVPERAIRQKRTLKTYSFSLKELQREGNLRDRGPSQGQSVKSL